MQKLILLVVAAAWCAVLVPPLLRARLERRPGSSVHDFHRHLSTLQRTGTGAGPLAPMRSMSRPLAPSGSRPVLRTLDQNFARGASSRRMVNQRCRQVVAVLAALTAATLVLAVVTQSDAVLYGFVVSAIVLCSYCYQLAQRARNQPVQSMRTPYRRVA